MHVAWVSPYLPEPATSGGSIRQQQLARALGRHASVHLFARADPWEKLRAKSSELAFFESRWLGRDYLRHPPHSTSSRVRSGSAVSMWRAVAALHSKVSLDLVVVCHSWAAAGVEDLGVPWLLDEHNIESRFFADTFAARGRQGATVERELEAMSAWERHLWARATGLCCVSATDAETMAQVRAAHPSQKGLERPIVIENGVDLTKIRHIPFERRTGGVLFVGSMHHRPNHDAALRLCTEIMPRVWKQNPTLPLTIVGGPISSELQVAKARAVRPGGATITLTGRVSDVAPFLEAAQVFACPMTHGAGSSLKTVEALASGAPLVSTEVGARGFELRADTHYLGAESDEDQAAAIVRVLADPALATRLATAGRLAAERHGWQALGERFSRVALACTGR